MIETLHVCDNKDCGQKVSDPEKVAGWIKLDITRGTFNLPQVYPPGQVVWRVHGKNQLEFCCFSCFVSYFERFTRKVND